MALRALGKGPIVIPGKVNRVANAFMTRVLPRRMAISIMARNTCDLASPAVSSLAESPKAGPSPPGAAGTTTEETP